MRSLPLYGVGPRPAPATAGSLRRGRRCGPDDEHTDVVLAPGPVGLVQQPVAHRLRIGRGPQRRRQPVVAHHLPQAVGTQQQPVVRPQTQAECVYRQIVRLTDAAVDHRLLFVGVDSLRLQRPGGDQAGNQRVVAGDLRQRVVAPEIGAAVADVGDGRPAVDDQRGGQRRAHIAVVGALGGQQLGVGGQNTVAQRPRHPRLIRATPGQHDTLEDAVEHGRRQLLGHAAAGNLTLGVAAHAVGHSEKA